MAPENEKMAHFLAADFRARDAVAERAAQAPAVLDTGLFSKGVHTTSDPQRTTLLP